jgi:proteasome lid subunit RPN8/RPN11
MRDRPGGCERLKLLHAQCAGAHITPMAADRRIDMSPRWAVELPPSIAQMVRSEIAHGNGCELCGFLLGDRVGDTVRIVTIRPVENIYHSPDAFAIRAFDYSAVIAETMAAPIQIVGLYHSHHGSAHLSGSDKQSIRGQSFVWLVIGIGDNGGVPTLEWRCFQAVGDKVVRLPLRWT